MLKTGYEQHIDLRPQNQAGARLPRAQRRLRLLEERGRHRLHDERLDAVLPVPQQPESSSSELCASSPTPEKHQQHQTEPRVEVLRCAMTPTTQFTLEVTDVIITRIKRI